MSSSPSPAPDLAIRPSLIGRAVEGLGTSILVGAALGALAWLSDQLQWPYSLLIPANMIGVWLALAFALGASARTIPTGALRGLIGLLAAVAVYYLLYTLGAGYRAIGAGHAATVWGLVALIAGPVMGGAGAVWRHASGRPRAVAVAVLAAALIAEGRGLRDLASRPCRPARGRPGGAAVRRRDPDRPGPAGHPPAQGRALQRLCRDGGLRHPGRAGDRSGDLDPARHRRPVLNGNDPFTSRAVDSA